MVLKRSAGHSSTWGNSAARVVPHGPDESLVVRHRRDVERNDATRSQVLPNEAEELAGREVERHVRLVVRVDHDQVVLDVGRAEERASVRVVDGEARFSSIAK